MSAVPPPPPRASEWPFDPADPEFLADPYPVFARLRERGEVHPHPGLGAAIAVSHAAAARVLRERGLGRIWADAQPAARFPNFNLLHRHSILESEPPTHTRLRGLVSAAFDRGHVERLRTAVRRRAVTAVAQLRTAITESGSADLLELLAAPLPVQVIADLLGVPESDRTLLRPWSNAIVKMYEPSPPERRRDEAEGAAAEFVAYLRGLVVRRRARPERDLLSDLVAVTDAGGRLTDDELVATAVLLLMAGHEATVQTIGNGVLALLRHRDQWQRLVDDPGLAATATEELIRYDSPLQIFERTATTAVVIAGHRLAPGDKIAALLGAAARDPRVFADPDRLDIGRAPNPHLGFGAGIHYCLGSALARVEVTAALTELVGQLPSLRLAAEPVQRPEFAIRGVRELSVTAEAS
ncbi:cytochrome P450 [Nocardia sp. CDC159]|uniref:Cytochrome P450 n=1 Tax=Nocardia pulmonis TaxID=2951408 RepID=A0A9X2EAT4_9NOCA|nr:MULTISPECIES: cytochrome P450 [Nocardia]MCM6776929.1 cytochrome P450 [Nocardia pulmonis]MCM6789353.1 cytochrome P450 [Nocardia sp. CDC159]